MWELDGVYDGAGAGGGGEALKCEGWRRFFLCGEGGFDWLLTFFIFSFFFF